MPRVITARNAAASSPAAQADRRAAARVIADRLAIAIPDPRCELDFANPFQLLVATMLSAQSTDKGVNRITPALFARYPTPAALAVASPADLEALIRSINFYRTKARHLLATAQVLVERHGGEVPCDLEALVRLPGVARKTANVVLGTAFGKPSGIAVDTHVTRVTHRLALSKVGDPLAIERDLLALYEPAEWTTLGHRLVLHGRYTCLARSPRCGECSLQDVCPGRESPDGASKRAAGPGRRGAG